MYLLWAGFSVEMLVLMVLQPAPTLNILQAPPMPFKFLTFSDNFSRTCLSSSLDHFVCATAHVLVISLLALSWRPFRLIVLLAIVSDRVDIHRVHRVRRVHRVPGSEKLNLRFRFSAPGVPKLGTSRFRKFKPIPPPKKRHQGFRK